MRRPKTKKFVSALIVVAVLLTTLSAIQVSAGNIQDILEELRGLDRDVKNKILSVMYDTVIGSFEDGKPTNSDTMMAALKGALETIKGDDNVSFWDKYVGDDEGQISEEDLEALCDQVLDTKSIIIDLHDYFGEYLDKSFIKELLGCDTAGDVVVKVLGRMGPVLTTRNNIFIRIDSVDINDKVIKALGLDVDEEELTGPQKSLKYALENDLIVLNNAFDRYVTDLNSNIDKFDIEQSYVISLLETYNLYKVTSPPTPTPTKAPKDEGGGGKPAPTAAPTPTATPTPTPGIITDEQAKDIAKDVKAAAEELATGDEETKVKVIQNLGEGLSNLVRVVAEQRDEDIANELANAVTDVLKNIDAAADDFSDDSIANVADTLNTVLSAAGTSLSTGASAEAQQRVSGLASEVLNSVAGLMQKAGNAENAVPVFKKVVKSTTTVLDNITGAGQNKQAIKNTIGKIAALLVEKAASTEVTGTVSGTQAKAVLDQTLLGDVINKALEAKNLADTLKETIKDAGVTEIRSTVSLNVAAPENSTSVDMTFPAELFDKAGENDIDTISVNTGIAKVNIPANAVTNSIQQAKGAVEDEEVKTDFSLDVSKVTLTDEQRQSLTQEQLAELDAGAEVFDFNAWVRVSKDDTTIHEDRVSKFNTPIEVSIPYKLQEGQDPEKITVLYLSDDGTVKNMIGRYDAVTKSVIFETDHFSKYVVKTVEASYIDVNDDLWAKRFIEVMSAKGVIAGVGDNRFAPDGLITRAEFAKLITVAGKFAAQNKAMKFTDVNETDWFYEYVDAAYYNGIITGYSESVFAPKDNITRQDMATMISRALGTKAPAASFAQLKYEDNSEISDYAKDAVAKVNAAEIMTGKPGNIFDPKGYTTRAEAAKVIYMFFKYIY